MVVHFLLVLVPLIFWSWLRGCVSHHVTDAWGVLVLARSGFIKMFRGIQSRLCGLYGGLC